MSDGGASVMVGRGCAPVELVRAPVDTRAEVEQLARSVAAAGWCAASWCVTCGNSATLWCIYSAHAFAGCRPVP